MLLAMICFLEKQLQFLVASLAWFLSHMFTV